jgi:hypothetical protein
MAECTNEQIIPKAFVLDAMHYKGFKVYVSTPFLVLVDEYINMPYKFYGKRKI